MVTFDFGIVRATASHVVDLKCGCYVQNYARIAMWEACTPDHDMILTLGWERASLLQLIEEIGKLLGRPRDGR